jgi:ornithine--oxo-acid transaminase
MITIPYNDHKSLEEVLVKFGAQTVAFLVEPIQGIHNLINKGEAGVVIPDSGYLSKCKKLCEKYNVLMICDEIQSGLGKFILNLR